MAVWLVCFFVIFALAELFDWIKELSLPLPVSILAGAFLAVVSNYDKIFGTYFHHVTPTTLTEIPRLDSPNSQNPISLPVNTSVEDHLQKSLPQSSLD